MPRSLFFNFLPNSFWQVYQGLESSWTSRKPAQQGNAITMQIGGELLRQSIANASRNWQALAGAFAANVCLRLLCTRPRLISHARVGEHNSQWPISGRRSSYELKLSCTYVRQVLMHTDDPRHRPPSSAGNSIFVYMSLPSCFGLMSSLAQLTLSRRISIHFQAVGHWPVAVCIL